MSEKKIQLNILGLSYSQTQSGAYALVLTEENGERRIPIIIGGVEAQSIAIKLEGLEPPRPLTHDLFVKFAETFTVGISEVVIYKIEEGIFYAELVCIQDGKETRIDSRTSDAVALALRFDCPIYTYESILQSSGIILDTAKPATEETESSTVPAPEGNKYTRFSVQELKKMVNESIEKEDYELAAEITAEIKKRDAK